MKSDLPPPEQLIKRSMNGETWQKLADEYGVSRSTIITYKSAVSDQQIPIGHSRLIASNRAFEEKMKRAIMSKSERVTYGKSILRR